MDANEKLQRLAELDTEFRAAFYAPTVKQADFHAAGVSVRFRLLMAGNQSGKSYAGAMEIAYHLTGEYPPWWTGRRYARAPIIWVAGVTGESTRDNPQRLLLGRGREWGTGTVPKHLIEGTPTLARGVADAVDSFQVRHASGDIARCMFKSYEKGREKWQGETLDAIWFDEEPPYDIWVEGQTRLNRRQGIALITFTPLKGLSKVVNLFLRPDPEDLGRVARAVIQMDLDDASFYSKAEIDSIVAQYMPAEREARIHGRPAMGTGLIYPTSDTKLVIPPFEIPAHFRRLVGMDFGWDHPAALAWIAHDPDTDIVYLYDCWRERHVRPPEIADRIRIGGDAPVSWPHDGLKTEMGSGVALMRQFEDRGITMLPVSARYDDETGGSQKREPIIMEMYQRMETGRFKVVLPNGHEFLQEKGMYHRDEDNKVVDMNDDLISAVHYAVMMLRYAEAPYMRLGIQHSYPTANDPFKQTQQLDTFRPIKV